MPQARQFRAPNAPPFEETDPIFLWVEKNWAEPCTAQLPQQFHSLCLFGPPLMLAVVLLTAVALLAWCDKRSKTKQLNEKETKKYK